MAKRLQFTQNEWIDLAKAPIHIALAVMSVGMTNPFQILREQVSMGRALQITSEVPSAGALIRELNVEVQAQLNEMTQSPVLNLQQTMADLLVMCRRVAALVDTTQPGDQADEYKRWLLWIGREVAIAAHEGDPNPVSTDEASLLDVVAEALGVQRHPVVETKSIVPEIVPSNLHTTVPIPPTSPTELDPPAESGAMRQVGDSVTIIDDTSTVANDNADPPTAST